MADYRELCPSSTIFPKLHYLEEHVVDFIQRWKVGPGMMGEHGGESMHCLFSALQVRFASTPDVVMRYQNMLKQHLVSVNPNLPAAPEPARKKKKV